MNEETTQVRHLLAKALDMIDRIEQGKEHPEEVATNNNENIVNDVIVARIIDTFANKTLNKKQQNMLYCKIKGYIGCGEKIGQVLKRLGYLSTYTPNILENWNDLYIQKINNDVEGEIKDGE